MKRKNTWANEMAIEMARRMENHENWPRCLIEMKKTNDSDCLFMLSKCHLFGIGTQRNGRETRKVQARLGKIECATERCMMGRKDSDEFDMMDLPFIRFLHVFSSCAQIEFEPRSDYSPTMNLMFQLRSRILTHFNNRDLELVERAVKMGWYLPYSVVSMGMVRHMKLADDLDMSRTRAFLDEGATVDAFVACKKFMELIKTDDIWKDDSPIANIFSSLHPFKFSASPSLSHNKSNFYRSLVFHPPIRALSDILIDDYQRRVFTEQIPNLANSLTQLHLGWKCQISQYGTSLANELLKLTKLKIFTFQTQGQISDWGGFIVLLKHQSLRKINVRSGYVSGYRQFCLESLFTRIHVKIRRTVEPVTIFESPHPSADRLLPLASMVLDEWFPPWFPNQLKDRALRHFWDVRRTDLSHSFKLI